MKKILLLAFSFVMLGASAQNVEFDKDNFKDRKDEFKAARNNFEDGNKLFEEGWGVYKEQVKLFIEKYGFYPTTINEVDMGGYEQFQAALPLFLKAQDFNPNNALLNYRIGFIYLNSNYKLKAKPYFEKAFALNPAVSPDINYMLGRSHHLAMDWEKAMNAYKAYQASLKVDSEKIRIADINRKIQECINGKELMKNPVRVFIDNIGPEVNSPNPDYGSVISADESVIIFTSRRPTSTGAEGNYYPEDIFISTKVNGRWTPAKNIGKPINTEQHDATAGLSPDGTKLFVYIDEKGNGNLYECNLKGELWSKPERMNDNINTKYHESSASLGFDGKTLYFVSQREGGMGSRDIYMSKLNDKLKWDKAVNAGPAINTQYGEEGAVIHPDGKTLYFSSQGHKGMGGYDIFKSVYENGKWSEPENLGYPINTPDDDIFFTISASGKRGYYTSFTSDGYGEKDIYVITFLGPEKPVVLNGEDNLLASLTAPVKEVVIAPTVEIKVAQVTLLKGVITDALTQKPLEAQIELIDNTKNEVIATFTSNSSTGKYLVSLPAGKNYGIAVKKEGYLFHSENFDIPASAAFQEVNKDVQLKNVAVGSKIVLKNIFFDFGKATLRPESTNELERLIKLLNDVPTLRIEISGHTDNKSSAEFNQKLSEARAKAVVDYLVGKGIDKTRLTAVGYGLTQPIATNDTDEGRQMNRRTEFKILSK
jgi:outer membrane protein OmpA-like peptidoglycan-associated protein